MTTQELRQAIEDLSGVDRSDKIMALFDRYDAEQWHPASDKPETGKSVICSTPDGLTWGYWAGPVDSWCATDHSYIHVSAWRDVPALPQARTL
jgi:hypothetical protein